MKKLIITLIILCFMSKGKAQTDSTNAPLPKFYLDASVALLLPMADLQIAFGRRITNNKSIGGLLKTFISYSTEKYAPINLGAEYRYTPSKKTILKLQTGYTLSANIIVDCLKPCRIKLVPSFGNVFLGTSAARRFGLFTVGLSYTLAPSLRFDFTRFDDTTNKEITIPIKESLSAFSVNIGFTNQRSPRKKG
jgi:hypothetical protein